MTQSARDVPAWAEWLLVRAAPEEDKPWIAQDLEEEMRDRSRADGRAAARRWYVGQVLLSIWPLLARRATAAIRVRSRAGDPMWQALSSDLRYAVRVSLRTPLTTAAVIATIVLGIGATTAVFSVVDAVLIKPLPFPHSDRTIKLSGVLRNGNEIPNLAYPDLLDFRQRIPLIERLGVVRGESADFVGQGEPQRLALSLPDEDFVKTLDMRAAVGRLFTPEEYVAGAPRVAVLTYGFWMREFGGDRRVVGSVMQLDGQPTTIVGILRETSFAYPTGPLDLMMPLRTAQATGHFQRGNMWAEAIVTLRPGVTLDDARRALSLAAAQLEVEYPDANKGIGVRAEPFRDAIVGSVGRMLTLLTLGVAAVLLIACVNVGNLLLGHASTRTREFAVRAALGGGVGRIRTQVLTETLLLAVIGGVVGVLFAPLLTKALVAAYPGALPRAPEVGMNIKVVLVATGATLLAALLACMPAARRAASRDLVNELRGGRGAGVARAVRRSESILVATQVASSLTLVFIAGLLVRTFFMMTRVDPGFDAAGRVVFRAAPSFVRYPKRGDAERYFREVETSLQRIPGVISVAAMTHVPFGGGAFGDIIVREDLGDQGPRNPLVVVTTVSPGFDRVLGLPVRDGRSFTVADDSAAPRVLMMNQSLARAAFPGEDPIGKFVRWNGQDHWRIVGVVADAHDGSLIEPGPQMLYTPFSQSMRRSRYVVVRSSSSAPQTIAAVRSVMRAIDPTVPLTEIGALSDSIDRSADAHRFRAWLIGSLGLLACALALIGIYAIVSQRVSRQTREIGIRIALGQDGGSVQREIIGRALRIAAMGGAVGVLAAALASRSMSAFLYGVSAYDPSMLGAAAALMLGCCALASFIPARRASRVDPVVALRAE